MKQSLKRLLGAGLLAFVFTLGIQPGTQFQRPIQPPQHINPDPGGGTGSGGGGGG